MPGMDRRTVLSSLLRPIAAKMALSTATLLAAVKPLTAQGNAPLKLGVIPKVNARTLATQYEPLQSYLTKQLRLEVQLATTSDWQSFYKAAKLGGFDLIVAPAHFARMLQNEKAAIPIATFQPRIKSVFVTLRTETDSRPIMARGKSIAFANPLSLVSMAGEQWLDQNGLRLGIDYQNTHVRGEDSVGPTVARGEAFAGVMGLNEFNAQSTALKDQLKVSAVIAELPAYMVLTAKHISESTSNLIASHIGNFSENSLEGKQFLQKAGFSISRNISVIDMKIAESYGEKIRPLLT